jgi:uncharacterized protein YgiM (DUF1202 family)
MQLTCYNCQKTWKVLPLPIAAAKLKFALGFDDFAFTCPKCKKGNVVTKEQFEAAMEHDINPVPAGGRAAPARPGFGPVIGKGGPAKPVPGPGPAMPGLRREGVVIARSLHVRKDHSTKSETMAGLRKGDKVTVIGTWSDGKNTWAKLGEERWAAIIYNDEPLIEFPG